MAPFARNNGRIIDMKNADLPANPVSIAVSSSGDIYESSAFGLTKREHFAGLAMAALITGLQNEPITPETRLALNRISIVFADGQLAALEE